MQLKHVIHLAIACLERGLELGWLSHCHPVLSLPHPQPSLPSLECSWHLVMNFSALATQRSLLLQPHILTIPLLVVNPDPGLIRAVKGLRGCDAVQAMNSYSVPGPTLWCMTFQSPTKYVRAMTAPLTEGSSCCPPDPEGSSQPLPKGQQPFSYSQIGWWSFFTGLWRLVIALLPAMACPHADRSSSCPEGRSKW